MCVWRRVLGVAEGSASKSPISISIQSLMYYWTSDLWIGAKLSLALQFLPVWPDIQKNIFFLGGVILGTRESLKEKVATPLHFQGHSGGCIGSIIGSEKLLGALGLPASSWYFVRLNSGRGLLLEILKVTEWWRPIRSFKKDFCKLSPDDL